MRPPVSTLRGGGMVLGLLAAVALCAVLQAGALVLALESPTARPALQLESCLAGHLRDSAGPAPAGFTPSGVARQSPCLSPALQAEIARYFARRRPSDEVPPIDGDPFTDTQEPPDGFRLGRVREWQRGTEIAVRFDDGAAPDARSRTVRFRLLRDDDGRWRIDDLVYSDGQTLRSLLG